MVPFFGTYTPSALGIYVNKVIMFISTKPVATYSLQLLEVYYFCVTIQLWEMKSTNRRAVHRLGTENQNIGNTSQQ